MNLSAILGPAGSGKTTRLRERIGNDPNYAILTATTGIAAVNLGDGITTVNSQLKFFDEGSLKWAHDSGKLENQFIKLARMGKRNIVIDEVSMLNAQCLDYIVSGACQAEETIHSHSDPTTRGLEPVGIVLCGDLLQLPPVKGEYAFKALNWQHFEIEKLTHIYRQTDDAFIEALTYARKGSGVSCAQSLNRQGVKFVKEPQQDFDGVTLFPTNVSADKFNRERLARESGDSIVFSSARWGVQRDEWKHIPQSWDCKIGALVMILANETKEFTYVNGDLATLTGAAGSAVELSTRRGKDVVLSPIIRTCTQLEEPKEDHIDFEGLGAEKGSKEYLAKYMEYKRKTAMLGAPYYDPEGNNWIVGEIEYMPLRLGYASTIHKAQGLTLDRVQVDCRNKWGGNASMMYVALSRCRSLEGLQIVGDVGTFARRVCTSGEVMKWV